MKIDANGDYDEISLDFGDAIIFSKCIPHSASGNNSLHM